MQAINGMLNRTRGFMPGGRVSRAAMIASLALPWMVSAPARAQSTATGGQASVTTPADSAPAGNAQKDQEIIVTGSYLPQTGGSGSPVSVVDLATQPPTATLGELFLSQPEFNGNAVLSDPGANSQTGASFLNLRGLGPNATLILLNGKRMTVNSQPNTRGEYGVDVESLTPQIMLQRVEIVKDGASAIYGTDAVAGVVNFITRKHFSGVEMDASLDQTQTGGQTEYTLSGMAGVDSDRGGLVIGAEYVRRDPLNYYDYDSVVDYTQQPGALALSIFNNPGTYGLLPGQSYNSMVPAGATSGTVADPLCGDQRIATDGSEGTLTGSGTAERCRGNTQLGRSIVGGEDRLTVLASGNYDVSDYFQVNAQAGFTRKNLFRDGASGLPVSFAPVVPASNPGNPFGGAVTFSGRVPGSGSGILLASPTYTRTYHASVDFGGKVPIAALADHNWHWDVGVNWSESDSSAYQQDVVKQHLVNALNGLGGYNCNPATGTPGQGNCFYYNPFASAFLADPGTALANSQDVLDYVLGTQDRATTASLFTWNAVVRGDLFALPGGEAAIAVGYEGRRETASSTVDPTTKEGGYAFITQEFDFDASRTYNAGFFEVKLPILPQLEVQGAGRYEAYGSKHSFNPKIGVIARPTPWISLRGTYGKSFQAPSLRSVYGTSSSSLNGIVFPGINAVSTKAVVAPNPDLEPQKSTSWTAGLEVKPVDGLRLSADYYSIDFKDLVGLESAQLIINDYIATGANADRLVFDPTGSALVTVYLKNINASSEKTAGWDFNANYAMDTGIGHFSFNAAGTLLSRFDYQETANDPVIDGVGSSNTNLSISPLPKWRATGTVVWSSGPSRALAAVHYLSGLSNPALASDDPLQNRDGYTTFDLSYSYRFANVAGGPLEIRAGVINIFNKLPPFQAGQQFYPIYSGVYDPRGRRFTLELRKSF